MQTIEFSTYIECSCSSRICFRTFRDHQQQSFLKAPSLTIKCARAYKNTLASMNNVFKPISYIICTSVSDPGRQATSWLQKPTDSFLARIGQYSLITYLFIDLRQDVTLMGTIRKSFSEQWQLEQYNSVYGVVKPPSAALSKISTSEIAPECAER